MLLLSKKIKGALLCLLFLAPFAMAQAPQITYPSEANLEGTIGQRQSWQFESDQWDSGNEWSVVGTLPDGLWLDYYYGGYCQIFGEPTTTGTFSFTLRIENSNGSSTRTFTMEIKPPPPPEIAYPEESSLEVALGQYVDWEFQSSQTNWDEEWSVVGALPDGLELADWCQREGGYYCYISGQPTSAGTFPFTLRIENSKGSSTRTFTLNVRMPSSPEIETASLPGGTMGEYYREYLEASDFAEWRVESGALPDGLWLSSYNNGYGYIGGMPTKKGTYTFTVKAENVSGSSTKQFSITIDAEQQKPQITYGYVEDGNVGRYFDVYFESDLAANWSISSGSLPPGLALDCGSYSSYCYIEGTPTTTGTYSFTIKAANSVGSSEMAFSIKIYSEGSPPYIEWSYIQDYGTWGERYSQQLRARDRYTYEDITNKVRWSISSGSLPPGLTLNASNGTISGTPTGAGYYNFTVMAENSAGEHERDFYIYIENVAPEILTASVPKGEVGALYNVSLQSKGSVTWSITSGSLPSGLSLNAETGVISGMPPIGTTVGDYTFTVEAYNNMGYDAATFTITVEAMKPAAITTETLAKGTVGSTYYGRISSTSYLATIEKTSGELPDGLTLNLSGTFSGAPTKAGTYKFKVKATNEAGSDTERGEKEFTLVVEEAPIIDDGSPIRSQIAVARGGNAHAYAQGSAIVLENIPQNAKVEVYNLKGRQVYSGSSENSQTLRILVQSKGVYVVKANKAAYRVSVR